MKTPTALCALLLLGLLAPLNGLGETARFGDYTVHYVAVNSTFLDPDIASEYDILRGQRRGFINVAVLKNLPDGGSRPVTAAVSGGKQNLMQQSASIDFREVREGDAIYYLGQFEFSNAEDLRFRLEVQPEGEGQAYPLEWTTRLYMDR